MRYPCATPATSAIIPCRVGSGKWRRARAATPNATACFTAEVAESAEESAVPNVVGFLTTKTQVGGVGEEGMEGLGPDVREHWHEIGGGNELTAGAERVIL